MIYLVLLALAPAIGLMVYVWNKDKSKEPPKMLALLVLFGVLSSIPSIIIETIGEKLFSVIFTPGSAIYNLFYYFFVVALAEEGSKFLFMFLYTRKHKDFDGLFDGMIYAIFVSLGFAAFENIFYVIDGGIQTAVMRAVLSVPGHMFFAVFMGYYYSMWHTYKLCDESEKYFANLRMITPKQPPYKYNGYLALSLIVPIAIHGYYDFALSMQNIIFVLSDLALMIALYIICFMRIKKMSKRDMQDYQLIPMLLCQKYPELIGVIMPREAHPMNVAQSYYQQRMPVQNNAYAAAGAQRPAPQQPNRPVYNNQNGYRPNQPQRGSNGEIGSPNAYRPNVPQQPVRNAYPNNQNNYRPNQGYPNQGYPNLPNNFPKGNNQNNNYR